MLMPHVRAVTDFVLVWSPGCGAALAVIHLVLVVVPALAQGQARAADVYHVVQVVRDLVDLAVGVAIVCHIVY